MEADFIVTGTIYTGCKQEKEVEMMAIKDGKICFLGSREETESYLGPDTKLLELKEQFVMPGIFEGHAHTTAGIIVFQGVNLYEKESVSEYMQLIDEYIEKNPEKELITGRGFINSCFGERGPTKELLDQKYPDKYFYLESEDCHSCLVNQKTLELSRIGKDTKACKNGEIVRDVETQEPTGWLKEMEMEVVKNHFPKPTIEEYKNAILKYQEMAVKNGITAAYEPIYDVEGDHEKRIEAFRQLEQEEKLWMNFRLGITVYPSSDQSVIKSILRLKQENHGKHYQIIGIKIFIDGVIEGHTGYLRLPYADAQSDCGYSMWNQENLNAVIQESVRQDLSVHIHVIGDAALDVALDAFEAVKSVYLSKDLRNCVTHLQIVQKDQIRRMKELNLIAVTNPYWHFKNPDYFDKLEVPFLGKDRAEKEYPMKSFLENGIVVTQASDWPVTYFNNPFTGIEIAHTRKAAGQKEMMVLNEEEVMSVEELMPVFTKNGAYQLKLEEELGTLEVGKKANFIVLNQNPLTAISDKIHEIEVMGNYFEGKDAFN